MAEQLPAMPEYTPAPVQAMPNLQPVGTPLQRQFSEFLAGPATKMALHLTEEQANEQLLAGMEAVRLNQEDWIRLGKKEGITNPYWWKGGYQMSAHQSAIDVVQAADMEWAKLSIDDDLRRDPDGYKSILDRLSQEAVPGLPEDPMAKMSFWKTMDTLGARKVQSNGEAAINTQITYTINKGANAVGSLLRDSDPYLDPTDPSAALDALNESVQAIATDLRKNGMPMSLWNDGKSLGVHENIAAMYIEALSKWQLTPEQFALIDESFHELEAGTGKLSDIAEIGNMWASSEAARLRNFGNINKGAVNARVTGIIGNDVSTMLTEGMRTDDWLEKVAGLAVKTGESEDAIRRRYNLSFEASIDKVVQDALAGGSDPRVDSSARFALNTAIADMIVNYATVTQTSIPNLKARAAQSLRTLKAHYNKGTHDDWLDFRLPNMSDDDVLDSLFFQAAGRASTVLDEDENFIDKDSRLFFDAVGAKIKITNRAVGSADIDRAIRDTLNLPPGDFPMEDLLKFSEAIGTESSDLRINYTELLDNWFTPSSWKEPEHLFHGVGWMKYDDVSPEIKEDLLYQSRLLDHAAVAAGITDKDARIDYIKRALNERRMYSSPHAVIENTDPLHPGYVAGLPQAGVDGRGGLKDIRTNRFHDHLIRDLLPYKPHKPDEPMIDQEGQFGTYDAIVNSRLKTRTEEEVKELRERSKATGKNIDRLLAEDIFGLDAVPEDLHELAMPMEYFYLGESTAFPGFTPDNVQLYFDHNGNITFHTRGQGGEKSPLYTISASDFNAYYEEWSKADGKRVALELAQTPTVIAIEKKNNEILDSIDFTDNFNTTPAVPFVEFRRAVDNYGNDLAHPWPDGAMTQYLSDDGGLNKDTYYYAERIVDGDVFRYTRPLNGLIVEVDAGKIHKDARRLLRSMGHDGSEKWEGQNAQHGNGRYRFWRGTDLDGNPTLAFGFEEYGTWRSYRKEAVPPNGSTAWEELTDDEINTLFKRVGVDATKYHITEGFDESRQDQTPFFAPYFDPETPAGYGHTGAALDPISKMAGIAITKGKELWAEGDSYAVGQKRARRAYEEKMSARSDEINIAAIEMRMVINDLLEAPPRGGDEEAVLLIGEDKVWATQEERQAYKRTSGLIDQFIYDVLQNWEENPITQKPWSWGDNEVLTDIEMAEHTYWSRYFRSIKPYIIDIIDDPKKGLGSAAMLGGTWDAEWVGKILREAHRRARLSVDPEQVRLQRDAARRNKPDPVVEAPTLPPDVDLMLLPFELQGRRRVHKEAVVDEDLPEDEQMKQRKAEVDKFIKALHAYAAKIIGEGRTVTKKMLSKFSDEYDEHGFEF